MTIPLLGYRTSLNSLIEKSWDYSGGEQGEDHSCRIAEKIIGEGVLHFSLSGGLREAFMELGHGALERVAIAWVLCRKTSVSQKWIAQRLGVSSAANVSQQVRRFGLPDRKLGGKVREWKKIHEG